MMKDLAEGIVLNPSSPEPAAVEKLVQARQPHYFTFADWQKLDEMEVAEGEKIGRPRLKFTCVEDMLAALGR
jgi:ferredoxin--NADP+ reductase